MSYSLIKSAGDPDPSLFAGQRTMKVEWQGQTVTSVVCEHSLAAIECPECDVFGAGVHVIDMTTRRGRLWHKALTQWSRFKRGFKAGTKWPK